MSKESYIRGFCKAAEAHGVDPQALAKFAAGEFAGAVPTPGAVAVGKDNIPAVSTIEPKYPFRMFLDNNEKVNSSIAESAIFHNNNIGRNPKSIAALEMGAVDPKYWAAHTTAVDRVTAPWRKAVKKIEENKESSYLPDSLRDAMIRNYHNEMSSLTNTPTRVSAPVKK